jgi:DNA-binding beta-propeller fold protein YncE
MTSGADATDSVLHAAPVDGAADTTATDGVAAFAAAADTAGVRLVREALVAPRGDGRGEVLEPAGIAADAFGRIYVTDAALHRLQRLDASGAFLGEAGSLGSRPGELRRPGAVALLGALGIAVLDRENRRIASYDLFGRFQGILVDLADETLLEETGRIDPIDLATDRGGAIYVADADRDRLLAFDFAGRFLRAIGGFGAKPGSFRGLAGVAVGPDGVIVTAERGERRVQRLDAGGRPIEAWPIDVARSGEALAVAVDDSGYVAVADPASGRIICFGRGGVPRAAATTRRPRALAFTAEGRLLVAEDGEIVRYAIGRPPLQRREE